MRLVLLRHAPAEAHYAFQIDSGGAPDSERPLTASGISKMKQAARGLVRLLDNDIQRVVSSPYARAQQTAKIVLQAMPEQQRPALEQSELLMPGCSHKRIRKWLSEEAGTVVLVGHEPDLSWLMERFCGAQANLNIKFGKAGACLIRFKDRPGISFGVLQWLLNPATLRMLGNS